MTFRVTKPSVSRRFGLCCRRIDPENRRFDRAGDPDYEYAD
jgi:hypothetical protein